MGEAGAGTLGFCSGALLLPAETKAPLIDGILSEPQDDKGGERSSDWVFIRPAAQQGSQMPQLLTASSRFHRNGTPVSHSVPFSLQQMTSHLGAEFESN